MKTYGKIASTLRNAFNHFARGESSADLARKPEAIAALMESSAPAFNTSANGYAGALKKKLSNVRTQDLEFLKLAGISVGIDLRFARQPKGQQLVDAVFYSKGDKGGILSLAPHQNGAYVNGNAREAINRLSEILRTGQKFKEGEMLYAAFVAEVYGRIASTETRWISPKVKQAPFIAQHAALKKPPKIG